MKKLNITTVEYQARVRKQAKDRTKRFREEQEKRGYKNLTVYLSKSFRAELERLSREKGLNRQDAMDHIFEIYHQNITNNVTSNEMTSTDKGVKTPVNTGSKVKRGKIIKKSTQDGQIKETQTEIPAPCPDRSDKEAYRIWLYKRINALKDSGMTWNEVSDKLNADGTETVTGISFGSATARIFVRDNREKMESK